MIEKLIWNILILVIIQTTCEIFIISMLDMCFINTENIVVYYNDLKLCFK